MWIAILFINDLPLCLQLSLAFIYADDSKCLRHVQKGFKRNELSTKDFDNLFQWSLKPD